MLIKPSMETLQDLATVTAWQLVKVILLCLPALSARAHPIRLAVMESLNPLRLAMTEIQPAEMVVPPPVLPSPITAALEIQVSAFQHRLLRIAM